MIQQGITHPHTLVQERGRDLFTGVADGRTNPNVLEEVVFGDVVPPCLLVNFVVGFPHEQVESPPPKQLKAVVAALGNNGEKVAHGECVWVSIPRVEVSISRGVSPVFVPRDCFADNGNQVPDRNTTISIQRHFVEAEWGVFHFMPAPCDHEFGDAETNSPVGVKVGPRFSNRQHGQGPILPFHPLVTGFPWKISHDLSDDMPWGTHRHGAIIDLIENDVAIFQI